MRALRAVGALLLLGSLSAGVPWPGGNPPGQQALQAMVADAVTRWEQERFDAFGMAQEDGKDLEIATVPQTLIDNRMLSTHALQVYGRQIFILEFRTGLGYGGDIPGPTLQRVHDGAHGGRDTYSCGGCHSVGGRDGGGGPTQTALVMGDGARASSAAQRNPPALLGAGLVQALAAEMSAALQQLRAQAVATAARTGQATTVELVAKGVHFGQLTATPDGAVQTHALQGIDPDLVVKPFGWKGDVARLRTFVAEAARVHFGIQAASLSALDLDADGVVRELDDGSHAAATLYLDLLEVPVVLPPADPSLQVRWANGDRLFSTLGCDACHTRTLTLDQPVWTEPSTPDGRALVLDLLREGDAPRGTDSVALLSDLKRHDMGPALADPIDTGVGRAVFLTRPLWGLAETAPYLHDGRAPTIPAAILAHGGEAQVSRDAFAALTPAEQADVHVFLLALTRTPKVRVVQ